MGFITPENKDVLDFKGLHLYHSSVSNCSMRVVITLEEKGVPWTSHHLNIVKKEHITPEYFGINPNGLVPTLVHDGKVMIESGDIIDYLDDQFPDPPLKPPGGEDRELMYRLIKRATSMHLSTVKPYIYYKRMRGKMKLSEEDDQKYRSLQSNKDLLEFHRKSSADEFTEEEIDVAQANLDAGFAELDELLQDGDWLVNNTFTLADIAWIPLHFTLDVLAGFDFSPYPNVAAWTKRLSERESYRKGVLQNWPSELKRA